MALLFLKQKLFPTREENKPSNGKHISSPQTAQLSFLIDKIPLLTLFPVKPLLSRTSDDDDDTIRGDSDADQDIESQSRRSYDTFGRESTRSNSSTGSTRARINPRIVSDAILGLSDGLTVPFALSAGLSALGNTKVVVLGGLAELAAGAISMGLGGYVGAKSEA